MSTKQVTLTIDGQRGHGARGHLDHARRDGGRHRDSETLRDRFAGCVRLLPRVPGARSRAVTGTPASCTTPVAAGMKVSTTSERVRRIRRGVMELYISDHPLDCLTSPVAGNCELQEMAGRGRLARGALRPERRQPPGCAEIDGSNPTSSSMPAKCIVCSRCVRACEETQGTFALTIQGRGFASKVAAGQASRS